MTERRPSLADLKSRILRLQAEMVYLGDDGDKFQRLEWLWELCDVEAWVEVYEDEREA